MDGLILVCHGAGGHAGRLNPFAFVAEVRQFYDGPLVLAGAITKGEQIAAAQALGVDMVYMGTRFIATQQANAQPAYKQMVLEAAAGISSIPIYLLACTVTTCAKASSRQGWTQRHCLRVTKAPCAMGQAAAVRQKRGGIFGVQGKGWGV